MSNSVVVASAGQGLMVTNDQTGRTNLVPGVVLIDPATGLPYAGSGGGGGGSVTVDTSALTKEATQLQVRDELVSIDNKTPALVGGGAFACNRSGPLEVELQQPAQDLVVGHGGGVVGPAVGGGH